MKRIFGQYKNNAPEEIDTATSSKEASQLLREYKMAFSNEWFLWIGNEKRK